MSPARQLVLGEAEPERVTQTWPTRRDQLRWLLSDGRWHSWRDCAKHGGARFGARLLELRRESGLLWEKKKERGEWFYRALTVREVSERAHEIADQLQFSEGVR